jgi:hypothetical protein
MKPTLQPGEGDRDTISVQWCLLQSMHDLLPGDGGMMDGPMDQTRLDLEWS